MVIEESSVSTNLIQYLKTEKQIYPISYSPTGSKVERANSASLYISSGQVLLPKEAIWLDNFKSEINAFPHGKHDDQVDALTQLILSALAKPNQISMMHETLYLNSLAKQGFTSAKEQYMIQKELEDYAEETTGSRVVSPDLQKLATDALYHTVDMDITLQKWVGQSGFKPLCLFITIVTQQLLYQRVQD